MDILEISKHNQQIAWKIVEESRLIETWQSIGAAVNIIGSLKTGLLFHRDIDLHIYSDEVLIPDSFRVMGELAERLSLKDIQYKNLLRTEEECIEWHASYEDEERNAWKFDMIHIRRGSKYDGVVEKVTDAIIHKLTPRLRQIILRIKHDIPKDALIPGIEVYHAVFTGNIENYEELLVWRRNNPLVNSLDWRP